MKKKGLLKKGLFTSFVMLVAPIMLHGMNVYAAEGMNTNENGVAYYEDSQGVRYGFYDDGETCYVGDYADTISENIIIPETITADGKEYTVTTIAKDAFDIQFATTFSTKLDDVVSIELPNTITTIEYGALQGLSSVEEIIIPKSVATMDFLFLPRYCHIQMDEDNSTYSSDEQGWLYSKDKTILYYANKESDDVAIIPNTVQIVEEYAFENAWFSEIVIPDSVKVIKKYAFANARFTEIEIPSSVEEIESYAFSGVYALEKITLHEGLNAIGNYAFAWCELLTEVSIPASVTSIEGNLFAECVNLTKISVAGNSSYYCTDECGNIYTKDKSEFVCANPTQGKITVSGTAKKIRDYAFDRCFVNEVVLEEGVTEIGASFTNCLNLEKITIPKSVVSIDDFAFWDANAGIKIYGYRNSYTAEYFAQNPEVFVLLDTLSSITATKTKTAYVTGDKLNLDDLVVTATYADNTKSVVKNYTTNVAQIDMTSAGAKQLIITYVENEIQKQTQISITVTQATENDNQTSTGGNTTTDNLLAVGTNVTISSGKYKVLKSNATSKEVAYIGTSDSKKTSVTIPATVKVDGYTYKVTEIAAKAFKNNKKIKSVTLGKNVKKIGKEAFSNCKKLKKITIKSSSLKSVGKNAIKNIDKIATINVPKKQLSKYKKLFKGSTGYKKTMKIKN